MDMIFTVRQKQEKCREQHRDLYMIFIDLTKAFDSHQQAWAVASSQENWLPREVRQNHTIISGWSARPVIDDGEMSAAFEVASCVQRL